MLPLSLACFQSTKVRLSIWSDAVRILTRCVSGVSFAASRGGGTVSSALLLAACAAESVASRLASSSASRSADSQASRRASARAAASSS